MKQGILFAGLLLIGLSAIASNVITHDSVDAPPLEKCVEWKKVCYIKSFCIRRDPLRFEACYRCIKSSQFGFHAYPRQLDRNTCNINTVDYLRNMGYRCYHPYDSTPCRQRVEKQYCDQQCVRYDK